MGAGAMENTMRLKVLGAASIAAIAMVACAKKDDAKTAEIVSEETATAAAADEAAVADATAEAADVYAAPATIDLASVRTKDALTSASDTAFAQADADANGALSQTEFYALAALMAPAPAVETIVDATVDAAVGAAAEATDAVVGDMAAEVVTEEPTMDSAALDASFAAIAGADANLTTDDLRAAYLSRFDAADANLDGALDDAEAETFKAANLF